MAETLELVETPAQQPKPIALPANASPAVIMQLAIQQGAQVETIERMWALQVAWEKREAERQFNEAFAAFKAHAVRVIKNRQVTDGPLKNKRYAELHAVVNAVTPALSEHGLSASWKLTKDDKDWIEVTCTLKHTGGHSESVSMGAPPDAGGAKNAIQSRASAVSYLERYTLKAILGVSEQEDDDDGQGAGGVSKDAIVAEARDGWIAAINECLTEQAVKKTWQSAMAELEPLNRLDAHNSVKQAVTDRLAQLRAAA